MTPEQKQRLAQIESKVSALPNYYPADFLFLLSLVKEQEAENERVLKLHDSAWLWVQQRVTHPNSGMPPVAMTLMEMLPLLPISMRSACVEKVKAMAAVVEHGDALLSAKEVIAALESLSIEKDSTTGEL